MRYLRVKIPTVRQYDAIVRLGRMATGNHITDIPIIAVRNWIQHEDEDLRVMLLGFFRAMQQSASEGFDGVFPYLETEEEEEETPDHI